MRRAQPGAGEARVGVGWVVDERRAARLGEGDELALLQADERPDDRHAVAGGRELHAAQSGDPGPAQETEQHRLRLIVGVMGGQQRIGADRLGVIDEQAVARLARALLQAARGLRALPLQNAMGDPEPGAERRDRLRLLPAFRPKAVIDRRRLDARPAAPPRPVVRHQEQRGRIEDRPIRRSAASSPARAA